MDKFGKTKKKLRAAVLMLLLIAVVFAAVSCVPVQNPGQTAAQTTAAQESPTPTAPENTPKKTEEQASQTSEPPNDEPKEPILSSEYLPGKNLRVTMKRYLGDSRPVETVYVYAVRENDESSYAVSRFDASQPIFYTDYFYDQEGMWSVFSDSFATGKTLILPSVLEEGAGFLFGYDEAFVEEIGATVEIGEYTAKDCLVVVAASGSYAQNVYHIFEKGLGETASFIRYDNDVLDIIFVLDKSEEITQEEADQVVSDSSF